MSADELERLRDKWRQASYDVVKGTVELVRESGLAREYIEALESRVKELEQQLAEVRDRVEYTVNVYEAQLGAKLAELKEAREEIDSVRSDWMDERAENYVLRAKLSGEPDGWVHRLKESGQLCQWIYETRHEAEISLRADMARVFDVVPVKLVRLDEESTDFGLTRIARGDECAQIATGTGEDSPGRPPFSERLTGVRSDEASSAAVATGVESTAAPIPARHTCDHAFPIDGDHERSATIDQVAWVFRHLVSAMTEGSSFRHLIYNRLGFGPEAYRPLYEAGGMVLTNAFCDLDDYRAAKKSNERKSIDDATPQEWREAGYYYTDPTVTSATPSSKILTLSAVRELQRKAFEAGRLEEDHECSYVYDDFDDYIKSTEGK